MGVFMAVYFSSINPDNWRIFNKLRVKEEQEKLEAEKLKLSLLEK